MHIRAPPLPSLPPFLLGIRRAAAASVRDRSLSPFPQPAASGDQEIPT